MAGGFDAELRAGVTWDETGTDRFINNFNAQLAKIGASVGGEGGSAFGVGELLRNLEAGIEAVAAEIRVKWGEAAAVAFVPAFDLARSEIQRLALSGTPGVRVPGSPYNASGAQVRAGYESADLRLQAERELATIIKANSAAAELGVGLEREGNDALKKRLAALTESIAFEKAFAVNLEQNAQLAAEEAQLRRVRVARTAALTATLDAVPRTAIATDEATAAFQSRLTNALRDAALNAQLVADSEEATLLRVAEANATYDKKIAALQQGAAVDELIAADGGQLLALQATAKVAAEERRVALARAVNAATSEAFAQEQIALALENEAGRLQQRLGIAQTALDAAASDALLGLDIVALKAEVKVVEEQRLLAEKEAVAALRVETGLLVPASSVASRAGILVPGVGSAPAGVTPQAGSNFGAGAGATANIQALNNNLAQLSARAQQAAVSTESASAGLSQVATAAQANGLGGTPFQRIQAVLRAGNRDPESFQTGGQLIGSQLLRVGSLALTGAAFFGIYRGVKDVLQESEALQVQMAIIRSQMAEVGEVGGKSFDQVGDAIIKVSELTGVAADQVALISRRLAGVYADTAGTPNFTKGIEETQTALKLAAVTGIPKSEITNDLVAISVSFKENFEQIGDTSIGLAQRFGQSEADIIKFTSLLAPTGKELGFTAEQLAGLGAVAIEFSGQPAASLAESLRRILPSLQQQRDKIFELFARTPQTRGFGKAIVEDLAADNGPQVIRDLIAGYHELTDAQQVELARLVGGRREAGALFAILENGTATLTALGTKSGDYSGSLEDRFKNVQQTVSFQLGLLGRSLEEFGIKLFQSGIGEGLLDIVKGAEGIAHVASTLIDFFSFLNDHLGGIPAELAGIAFGLAAIYKIMSALAALRAASIFTNLFAGAGGLAALSAGAGGSAVEGTAGIGPFANGALYANALGGGGLIGSLLKSRALPGIPLLSSTVEGGAQAGLEAGGLSAGLTGLLTIAAPVLAGYTLIKLKDTIGDIGNEIGGAKDKLRASVLERLKQGISPDEIRKQLEGHSLSFGEKAASFLTGQGTDDPIDEGNKTIAEFFSDQQKARVDAQVAAIDAFFNSDKGLDYWLKSFGQNRGTATKATKDRYASFQEKGSAGLKAALASFHDHPDDPTNLNKLNFLINDFLAVHPEEKAAFDKIAKDEEDKAKAYQKAQEAAQQEASLQDSLDAVKANLLIGTAGLGDLVKAEHAIKQNILTELEQIHLAHAEDKAKQKELAQNIKETSDAISQAAADTEKVFDEIAALHGADTGQFQIDQAQARYESLLSNPDVLPAAKAEAALNLVQKEQRAFEDGINNAVNAYGEPLNALQKQALYAKGFALSPEAQKALNEAQLLSQPSNDALIAVAPLIGKTVDALRDTVANAMVQYNTDAKTILISILKDKEALLGIKSQLDLQAALSIGVLAPGVDPFGAYSEDVAGLAAIDKAINSVQGSNITTGTANASTIAANNAAAAAQKRQDALDLLEHDRLVRDLGVAQSGDDPIKAAQKAIDDANAIIDFPGSKPDDILKAQAALARAQKKMAEAIRSGMDAQFDLLIAIDNFNGDSVKAAQDALRKLQSKLNDPLQTDTERAQLEAQIKSQELQVAETQISQGEQDVNTQLELGRISKGQAIAQLETLKAFAVNQKEIDQIDLEIKRLRDQLGQDFKFNLPSVLGLPTLYEARRVNETPTGSGYNDNRTINVTVNANTNADPQAIADAVASAVGGSNLNGTYATRY